MMQLSYAIASHEPARDRSKDLCSLKVHLCRVFTDIVQNITDSVNPISKQDIQFLFGGYSWRRKQFVLWTIYYSEENRNFNARPAGSFPTLINQVAFIGDRAKDARKALINKFRKMDHKSALKSEIEFAPLEILRDMLRSAGPDDSIGGPPQIIRIASHMNTRVLAVKWPGNNEQMTLHGRELFDYENVDNWGIDIDKMKSIRPRSFGYRP